jgi:hypothetical protein
VVSYYSVVQYVPDAVRNERVNIGVLAFGGGRVRSVFLQDWHRVKQFVGKDVSFLKEIAKDATKWDEETIKRLATCWTGSVQLTPPSASLLDPVQLLVDVGARLLVEQAAAERGYRIKDDVVRIAKRRIREKLVERLGAVGPAYLRDASYDLQGRHMAYGFDVTVANGQPFFAAQGLSFEVPSGRRLEKEISSTAWRIEDVKLDNPDFPIGVIVLPAKTHSGMADIYEKARLTFGQLKAEVVEENNLTAWAAKMVEAIPRSRP